MSQIKEKIKTSLTGTAPHLQQLVKEQSCGGNGCGNVVGGVQINRTTQTVNMFTAHFIPKTARAWRQPAHDKRSDWWNHRNSSDVKIKFGIIIKVLYS